MRWSTAPADQAGLDGTDLRVTLPKVTDVAQVEAMVTVLDALEAAYGLPAGRLGLELQVETPQAVLGADGAATVAPMVHAAGARCRGLHYGTYDYSASLGIAAGQQAADHPAADHAKHTMQVAVARERGRRGGRLHQRPPDRVPGAGPRRLAAAPRPGRHGWKAASTRGGICTPRSW